MEYQIRRSRRLAGLTPDPLDALKGMDFSVVGHTTTQAKPATSSRLCEKALALTLFVGFYAWLFSMV